MVQANERLYLRGVTVQAAQAPAHGKQMAPAVASPAELCGCNGRDDGGLSLTRSWLLPGPNPWFILGAKLRELELLLKEPSSWGPPSRPHGDIPRPAPLSQRMGQGACLSLAVSACYSGKCGSSKNQNTSQHGSVTSETACDPPRVWSGGTVISECRRGQCALFWETKGYVAFLRGKRPTHGGFGLPRQGGCVSTAKKVLLHLFTKQVSFYICRHLFPSVYRPYSWSAPVRLSLGGDGGGVWRGARCGNVSAGCLAEEERRRKGGVWRLCVWIPGTCDDCAGDGWRSDPSKKDQVHLECFSWCCR